MECLLCSRPLKTWNDATTMWSTPTPIVNPFRGSSASSAIQILCKILALRLDSYDDLSDFGVSYCSTCAQVLTQLHSCVQQLEQLEVKISEFKTEVLKRLVKPEQQTSTPLSDTPLSRLRNKIANDIQAANNANAKTLRLSRSSKSTQTQTLLLQEFTQNQSQEIVTMVVDAEADLDLDPETDPLASPDSDPEKEERFAELDVVSVNVSPRGSGPPYQDQEEPEEFQIHKVEEVDLDIKFSTHDFEVEDEHLRKPLISISDHYLEPDFHPVEMQDVDQDPHPVELKFRPEDLSAATAMTSGEIAGDSSPRPSPKNEVKVTRTATPTPAFCVRCSQSFDDLEHFIAHTRAQHFPVGGRGRGQALARCPFPGCNRSVEARRLELHIYTHTRERPFRCAICQHSYSSRGALTGHNRAQHTHVFKCAKNGCPAVFSAKFQLTMHRRKEHVDAAKKLAALEVELRRRREIESRAKSRCPFPKCGRAFRDPITLKAHLNTHAGPFSGLTKISSGMI